MLRKLVVHLLIYVMNCCLMHRDHHHEAFTTIFTHLLWPLTDKWIQHYTQYDVHTDAHTLSWEGGREPHTTVLLTNLLAFTLYMSSVLTPFFVPSLCWSSSPDFLCSTLFAGSVLSHREMPQNLQYLLPNKWKLPQKK